MNNLWQHALIDMSNGTSLLLLFEQSDWILIYFLISKVIRSNLAAFMKNLTFTNTKPKKT